METVKFARFVSKEVLPHKVYLKTAWSDAWQHVPYLYCDTCVRSVAPTMSTASLSWRFGNGIQAGKDSWLWYSRLTGKFRAWVKIEYQTHPIDRNGVAQTDPFVWVGTIETEGAQLGGVRDGFTLVNGQAVPVQRESGLQSLSCLGLEHTINRCPIGHGFWYDANGALRVSGRPFEFNAPDATGRARGNWGPGGIIKVFDSRPYTTLNTTTWSTRKIVRYLVQTFSPKDAFGANVFPLLLISEGILPDNDKPVLDPTGMTLWEALCNLVARTRMLGFYLKFTPAQGGNPDFVALQPYSLAGANQTFGEIEIPANANPVHIDFDSDPDIVGAGIKGASIPAIDQFLLRGARRTSTCSLSYADANWGAGWKIGAAEPDEQDYEAAASVNGYYAGLGTAERQKKNAEVRASAELHDVYRYFVHPGSAWDQQAGDGEGGEKHPVFPADGGQAWVNPRELFILPCVLLEEGRNYESLGSLSEPIPPPIEAPNANNRQPPLCFVKVPAVSSPDRYWVEGSKLAENAEFETPVKRDNRRFSLRVEVPQLAYGLYLHVEGEPQHAIAYSDFTPLPADPARGRYDWKEFIVTVSFEDDRYCEGVWPPTGLLGALFAAGQHIRQQILYAGDAYRQDWCVPGTVVGVNPHNGQLVRNATGGWLADDSAKLQARARQIHAYFSQPRRALTFSSGRINTALDLGDYIVERGDLNREAIGAVITQITISSPEGGEIPRITYDSSFLELDNVQI